MENIIVSTFRWGRVWTVFRLQSLQTMSSSLRTYHRHVDQVDCPPAHGRLHMPVDKRSRDEGLGAILRRQKRAIYV